MKTEKLTLLSMPVHRGARLTKQENGQRRRFTCPYHGWSFLPPRVVRVNTQDDFGEINKCEYSLKPLTVYESAGLIWGVLDPNSRVDIPDFLSGYDNVLEAFNFKDWVYVSKRTFKGQTGRLLMMVILNTTMFQYYIEKLLGAMRPIGGSILLGDHTSTSNHLPISKAI